MERIEVLMERAREVFPKDRAKANRYAALAKKLAMRYTLRFPERWKPRVCRKCHAFLVQGVNCKTRIQKGRVINTCLDCGHMVRFPILRG